MAPRLEVINDAKLNDVVNSYNTAFHSNLTVRGRSNVLVPPDIIRGLFLPIFDKMTSEVQRLLREQEVDQIFLVGGFGESALLQKHIKTVFETEARRVIVPLRPGLAVVSSRD